MKIPRFLKTAIVRRTISEIISNPSNLQSWYAEHVVPGKDRFFLAAAPKSGSTFLSKLLKEVFGWPLRDACGSWGYSEQQIYPPRLLPFLTQDGLIGNQHMKASEDAIQWLNLFEFRVIISIRNFADTVVSLRDDHLQSGVQSSMGFLTQEMLSGMNEDEHINYIIREMMPWYGAFFTSWKYYGPQMKHPPIWVEYAEMFPDAHAVVHRIGETISKPVTKSLFDESRKKIGNQNIRFNVGRQGRGREILSNEQIASLEAVLAPYKIPRTLIG